MASAVDIANLALSHLGDEAGVISITPPDGTVQAAHCSRYYPIARDAVLQAFPWSFATKRVALAAITSPTADWAYAYVLPSTCLRPLEALTPGTPALNLGAGETDTGSYPFRLEAAQDGQLLLYTNQTAAFLRYIDRITDTTRFPPLVVLAMARLLASYLAGPILKGDSGLKASAAQLQLFEREMAQAAAADARIGHRDLSQYRPAWITARDGGARWNIPPYGPVR